MGTEINRLCDWPTDLGVAVEIGANVNSHGQKEWIVKLYMTKQGVDTQDMTTVRIHSLGAADLLFGLREQFGPRLSGLEAYDCSKLEEQMNLACLRHARTEFGKAHKILGDRAKKWAKPPMVV